MSAVAVHPTLQVLTLSGNHLDLEGGHAVASGLGRNQFGALKELYLDHTELSQVCSCSVFFNGGAGLALD